MEAFIAPPRKISPLLRLGIWISEKITGRAMLPARILACILARVPAPASAVLPTGHPLDTESRHCTVAAQWAISDFLVGNFLHAMWAFRMRL